MGLEKISTANMKILVEIVRELADKNIYNVLANRDESPLIINDTYSVFKFNYDINLSENHVLKKGTYCIDENLNIYFAVSENGNTLTAGNPVQIQHDGDTIEINAIMLFYALATFNDNLVNKGLKKNMLKILEMPKVKANYEALKSLLPYTHIKPNNKLAREMTRDFLNEGLFELIVSRNGARKEIKTKAMLTYDNKNISLSGRVKLTPYDREVHDAVITLYVAGNEVVTPEMVYRAMTGKTETEKISPQAVGAVTRSLDKSRRIMVNIDFSQEAKAYGKNCKAEYEGYLLACDKITVTTGGKAKEAYKLLREPILYEYAQVSGQVISVPIKLLQTSGTLRNTDDVIVIKGYLIRQIEGMKSPSFKRSNKIKFEGVYSELEMDALSEKAFSDKSVKVRRHIETILKEWTEQNYIKGYTKYKERNTIKGVVISL